MPSNKNIERDIPIIGSDYFLHITRVGDKQTSYEKYIDYLREKGGYEVDKQTTDGITGNYLCKLTKEVYEGSDKYSYPEVIDTLFVPTDTNLEVDRFGNFLLKSYFSGLHDNKRIKNEGKEIGSTLVIPSLDKIRNFTDDTVIYAEENGLYTMKVYDDKEKNPELKFKYNFLNVNGEQIRDEHFAPVGSDGTPIIEEVNKPFYRVVDGTHITDNTILDEEVPEDMGIYPTSYVYRDNHTVTAYPNVASLLLSNARTGYPAIEDLTPYLEKLQERKLSADDLYRCVSLAREEFVIDKRTETIIINILNQEMDMIDEFEDLTNTNIDEEEMGE